MTTFKNYKRVLLKLVETDVPLTKGKRVTSTLTRYNKKQLLDVLLRYKNLYNKGLSYVHKNIDRLKTMKKGEVKKEIYWFLKQHNYMNFTTNIIGEMSKSITENLISQIRILKKLKKLQKNNNVSLTQMRYNGNTIYLHYISLRDIDLDNDIIRFNLFDKVSIVSKFITNRYLKKLLTEYLQKKTEYPTTQLIYNKKTKSFYISINVEITSEVNEHKYTLGIDINRNGMLCLYSTKTNTYEEVKLSKKTINMIKKIKKDILEVKKSTSLSNNKRNNLIRKMKRSIFENLKHEINRIINYILTKYKDHNVNIENINGLNLMYGNKYYIPYKIFRKRMLYKGIFEYKRLVRVIDPKDTSTTCPKCSHTHKSNRRGDNFKCRECGYEDNIHRVAAYNISKK